MSEFTLEWDQEGQRKYEVGVSKCALYVKDASGYGAGVAWSGMSQITNSPEGAEATPIYADNMKYLNLISAEDFNATIEAYTYPDEFNACMGKKRLGTHKGVMFGQQSRAIFGLVYQTIIGNDTLGENAGHKLHIIYGCTASPSEESHETTNESPDVQPFSWEVSTTAVNVTGGKATAHVEIDSTELDENDLAKLEELEKILYGDGSKPAKLLLPDEIKEVFDGTYSG